MAEFLRLQQVNLPRMYGEIFLTNRYGVMVATTGKLTTLAHAHKYWWQASYADGQGRIFFDDRGFDASVEGYVLGVVVPIKDENEIIGILKSNINIMGPLTEVVDEFPENHFGRLQIARTGGLVVAELGIEPLSSQIHDSLLGDLAKKERGSTKFSDNNADLVAAFSPVDITLGSDQYSFGGSYESIDHIKGNRGEAWHVVISADEEQIFEAEQTSLHVVLIVSGLFIILTSGVAFLFGQWVSKPIVELADVARSLGEGNLVARAAIHSNDEIGTLAETFNNMANELQSLTASLEQKVQARTEELKRSNDELEQFAYVASHDLKEPLRMVTSYLNLIERRYKGQLDDSARELITFAVDGATRMKNLIDDLLAYSRVSTQSKSLEPTNMNDVLAQVRSNLSVAITEANAQISNNNLPVVMGDEGQLVQLLQNLIANAIKFRGEQFPQVHISAEQPINSKAWQFSVKDNGIGIDPQFHERIFAIFQRLHTREEYTGTGIGLSVVKKIVERHGGRIWVESEPGEGTTFYFTLPVIE